MKSRCLIDVCCSEGQAHGEVRVEVFHLHFGETVAHPVSAVVVGVGVAEFQARVETDDEVTEIPADAEARAERDVVVGIPAQLRARAFGVFAQGPDVAAVHENSAFEPRKNIEPEFRIEFEPEIARLEKRLRGLRLDGSVGSAGYEAAGADLADAPGPDAGGSAHEKLFDVGHRGRVAERHSLTGVVRLLRKSRV